LKIDDIYLFASEYMSLSAKMAIEWNLNQYTR